MELEPPDNPPPWNWATRALVIVAVLCLTAVIIGTGLLYLLGSADDGALYKLMSQ